MTLPAVNLSAAAALEPPSPRVHRFGFGAAACSLFCTAGFVAAGIGAREPLYACVGAVSLVSALDSLCDALLARRRYVAALAAHHRALAAVAAALANAPQETRP